MTRSSLLSASLLLLTIAACAPDAGEGDPSTGNVSQSATAPSLGTTQSFAVLGGSAVTNTGATVVTGDLGLSPGTAVTGFPPGLVLGGTINAANAAALQAQNDATGAYNALAGQACDQSLTGQDLGGLTLTAGTYCFSSSAQLTGTLTLDAQGDPAAVFIFQIGSSLTTASNASVVMVNGGNSCSVFWQVGSSATLGTGTSFSGNVIALTSITLNTGANLQGRALARNGAVTLDTNNVNAAVCTVAPIPVDAGVVAPVDAGVVVPVIDAGVVIPVVDAGLSGEECLDAGMTEIPVEIPDSGLTWFDAGTPIIIDAGHEETPDGGGTCEEPCVDYSNDHENCGFWGNACLATEACIASACVCIE